MTVATRVPITVVALALAVTACGGASEDSAAGGAPAKAGPAAPASGRGGGSAAAQPAGAAEELPASSDLSNFSCRQRGGVWSASGDIHNSATEPMVYTVTVVTVAGTDVSGDDAQQFLLDPDQSTSFDFPGISRGSVDGCMPRLVRTPR